jgi:hypothetical protein
MTNIERGDAGVTYLKKLGHMTVGAKGWEVAPYDDQGKLIGTMKLTEKGLAVCPPRGGWKRIHWAQAFEKLLAVVMVALTLGTAQAADWPTGSPDGGWAMGTPDASYPMDGGNTQIANDRANREYQIAHHMIAVSFTSDEVLRAWGKPDEISRSVSDRRVLESWRYKNPYALVWFNNGIVDSIIQ